MRAAAEETGIDVEVIRAGPVERAFAGARAQVHRLDRRLTYGNAPAGAELGMEASTGQSSQRSSVSRVAASTARRVIGVFLQVAA